MQTIAYRGGMPAPKKLTKLPLGASGVTVAANVKRLMESQNLTFAALAAKLENVDRKIPTLGLRKIVAETRRVDADDLVALAVALGVSPVTLLMPAADDVTDPVHVTGIRGPVAAIGVWEWMRGRFARPGGDGQMNVQTWPRWEQEQVLAQYSGASRGDDQ